MRGKRLNIVPRGQRDPHRRWPRCRTPRGRGARGTELEAARASPRVSPARSRRPESGAELLARVDARTQPGPDARLGGYDILAIDLRNVIGSRIVFLASQLSAFVRQRSDKAKRHLSPSPSGTDAALLSMRRWHAPATSGHSRVVYGWLPIYEALERSSLNGMIVSPSSVHTRGAGRRRRLTSTGGGVMSVRASRACLERRRSQTRIPLIYPEISEPVFAPPIGSPPSASSQTEPCRESP